jgi:hypothetical protein
MVDPVLPVLTAAAGKEILKTSMGDLYDYVKSRAKMQLKRWNSDRNIAKAYSKLASVRKVKTLWQVDKAVDLNSFYCPSRVEIGKERERIDRLDEFGIPENILIEGIAGQGKSIFLRYLSAVEAACSNKVPVFIELRRIESGESVRSHIVNFLSDLRVDSADEVFDFLVQSGRIVLFLDAFDELDDDVSLSVLKELEHFSSTYDSLKIVVTSRPDSDLKMSRFFRVVKLSDLRRDEYELVIRKLLEYGELAEQLIARVKGAGNDIAGVLSTPLLVTLLVLIYKSYQEIPSQMSEFYDSLFQLLLQRHDGAKPGFRRRRRCKMNDVEYRKTFEAFCFRSKQLKSNAMRSEEIYDCAENAFLDVGIAEDPADFIKDIVKITCLLLEEGGQYRFIHKSVQEFYAACFLRRKPDKIVRDLYRKLVNPPLYFAWINELKFLSEIDTYRLDKFGMLPSLLRLLGIDQEALSDTMPLSATAKIRDWIGNLVFTFEPGGELANVMGTNLGSAFRLEAFDAVPRDWRQLKIDPKHFVEFKVAEPHGPPEKRFFLELFRMSWADFAAKGGGAIELDEAANCTARDLFRKAQQILQSINREEKEEPLAALLA